MIVVPAGTWVHRGHEHETGRIFHGEFGAADGDHTILQGLAQHLQHLPFELGQFIQEQHAIVREADLAGLRERTTTDQGHIADRMVR